ncbi:DUF5518 domain-containing protein [Salinirubellus salinus]|jgi:hypothetical protein|uniref:DUF5518 domain-containing protein n=1 Tax=Salinirubellus salinus TaxID=1364945 RepID=A0A9E7R343_9EURY|nr:DUF5518 domain-containing protein [Salinirubellus salinus]UWM53918.1 DUF5518 domain-containing protein [Salinirubellus salinus]
MPSLHALREVPTSREWRYPLLAGLVAGASIAARYWQSSTPSEPVDATAVFLAGLLGGALFHGTGASTRVGLRTGLVAGVAAIPAFSSHDIFAYIAGLSQPAWFAVVQAVGVVVVLAIVVCLLGLVGALGGRVGDWLAAKTGPERPASTAD